LNQGGNHKTIMYKITTHKAIMPFDLNKYTHNNFQADIYVIKLFIQNTK